RSRGRGPRCAAGHDRAHRRKPSSGRARDLVQRVAIDHGVRRRGRYALRPAALVRYRAGARRASRRRFARCRRTLVAAASRELETRRYRYYELLLGGFVAVLLCSNLIGPAKVVEIGVPLAGTA